VAGGSDSSIAHCNASQCSKLDSLHYEMEVLASATYCWVPFSFEVKTGTAANLDLIWENLAEKERLPGSKKSCWNTDILSTHSPHEGVPSQFSSLSQIQQHVLNEETCGFALFPWQPTNHGFKQEKWELLASDLDIVCYSLPPFP